MPQNRIKCKKCLNISTDGCSLLVTETELTTYKGTHTVVDLNELSHCQVEKREEEKKMTGKW